MSGRIAHYNDFPDYSDAALLQIATRGVGTMIYRPDGEVQEAMEAHTQLRRQQPHFENARLILNALDCARL
jgi:hypothetical protein